MQEKEMWGKKYGLNEIVSDFELIVLITATFIFFMYYGVVSHLASLIGFNTAYYLVTPLDNMIKYTPFWIVFYSLAELVPIITLLIIRFKIGPDIIIFRRMVISIFILLFINYLLYLLFPCSVIEMYGVPKEIWSHNYLERLVRLEFSTEAPWNANPSLHIGFSWIIYRFFSVYYKKPIPRILFLAWFVGMSLGTLTLKVHIIVNVILGFLLSELLFRYVYKNKITGKFALFLGAVNPYKRFGGYFILIIILIIGLHVYSATLGELMIISNKQNQASPF
ncbi:phosphatase PAP2 family protein [Legionella nagasakiensis]|uniref:phosphatase PAP2 family protein n=1 Tax=Legionella nagasakiensis TaxID=535290 RepID=UPI0010560BE5|nr:phosphatase PAP2 family protein [Legionella nagasakiensis]